MLDLFQNPYLSETKIAAHASGEKSAKLREVMEEKDLDTLRASKFTVGFFPRGVACKLTIADIY